MSDLKKAQQLRARKEMVRQKQQAAIEKRDTRANATRSENIARRKKAAEKVGKTFSYGSTVTPSAEGGPLNYGSPMKKSSCIKMYDSKGKPAGLMAEGSMAYMESMGQEKNNLMQDMPIDNRGVSQMSPYKLHGDANTPHPDPKKKATTTLSNALASDKDYEVVPGFEERLGGELQGVTLTASAKTNKQKRQEKRAANKKQRRNTYSKTGMAIQTLGTFLPGGGGKYKRRQLEKTARKGLF